jgi:hypothetical protein
MNQPKKSREEIQRIIDRIKFRDRKFRILEKGDGFLLQMTYYEIDVEDQELFPQPVLQSTRKWYVSPYMTTSEIVETAWLMVQRSQLHVASEHFTYAGRRVYSQHFSIGARVDLCDEQCYDVRIDERTKKEKNM